MNHPRFSPDGQYLVASLFTYIKIWRVKDGSFSLLKEIRGVDKDYFGNFVFSPDSKRIFIVNSHYPKGVGEKVSHFYAEISTGPSAEDFWIVAQEKIQSLNCIMILPIHTIKYIDVFLKEFELVTDKYVIRYPKSQTQLIKTISEAVDYIKKMDDVATRSEAKYR